MVKKNHAKEGKQERKKMNNNNNIETAVPWSKLSWKDKGIFIVVLMMFAVLIYGWFQTGKVQAYAHTLPNGKQAITAHFAFPPVYRYFYMRYDPSFDFEECIVSEYQGAYEPVTFSVGKPVANDWVNFSTRSRRSTDNLWKMNVTFVNPSDPETFLQKVKFRYVIRRRQFDLVSFLWPTRNMSFTSTVLQKTPPPQI